MNHLYDDLSPELKKSIHDAAAAGLNRRRQARRVLVLSLVTVVAVIAGGLWMSRSPDRVIGRTGDDAELLGTGRASVLCLRSAAFEGALIDVLPLTVRTLTVEDCQKLMDEQGAVPISTQQEQEAFRQAMAQEDRTLYVISRYAFQSGAWVEPWSLTQQEDGLTMTLAEDTAIAADGEDDGKSYGQKSYFFYILAAVKNDGTGEIPMDVRVADVGELAAGDQAEFHVKRLLTSPAGAIASSYWTLIGAQPAVWERILALPDESFAYMLEEAWSRRDDPSDRTQIMTMACMERVTGVSWRDTSQSPMLWLQENYDTLMEQGIPRPVGRLLLNEKRRETLAGLDRTDRDQALRAVLMENLTQQGYPVAVWDLAGEKTLGQERVALYLWAGAYGCGVDSAAGYQGPAVVVLERNSPGEPWYCLELSCPSVTDEDFDEVFGEFAEDARTLLAGGVESRHNEALREQIQTALNEGLPLCRPEHMAGEGPGEP